MKLLYTCLLCLLFTSCSKSGTENEAVIVICPAPPQWINAKKAELASCTCITEIRQGIYLNRPIIEIRITDPLCNGINMVYLTDGSVLLSSADQAAYSAYVTGVQSTAIIWTCSK